MLCLIRRSACAARREAGRRARSGRGEQWIGQAWPGDGAVSTVPEPVGSRVALLEPALLARLERSQLGTRRRLAGQLAGEHRSPLRGSSLEFSDFRPYAPGDDVRRIDPHVYARLDQLLVKLFEAEDDLTVRLLVDTSASMGHGGKLLAAKRLAAALGFVALVRRDSVSVHTVPASGRGLAGRTFRGRHAAWALFEQLALLEARGATAFVAAAGQLDRKSVV